jgi:short-subunit dehydrogenase
MKGTIPGHSLRNQYALITGAAGGLGISFIQACAARGYHLLLVDLPGKNADHLCNWISRNYPVDARYLEIDIATPGATRQILEFLWEENLQVSLLINNAGMSQNDFFEDTDEEYLRKLVEVNSIACVTLTRALLPELKKNKRSYIINVSSLAGFFSLPRKSCYAATKGFIRQFSKALNIELKNDGVTVSVLCPGPVTTNLTNYLLHKQINWFSRMMMQDSKTVAEKGIRDALKGKEVIIPGWLNRWVRRVTFLIPAFLKRRIAIHSMKQLERKKAAVREIAPPVLEEAASIPA